MPTTSEEGSHRVSFRKAIVVIVLLALLGGCLFSAVMITQFVRSPRYSLAMLAVSFNAGDWEGVRRYMDVEEVSNDIADRVVDERLGESGLDLGLGNLGDELSEDVKPIVAEQVRKRMQETVERRQGNAGLREILGAMWYTRNRSGIRIVGGDAIVAARLRISGQERILEFRMRRENEVWRVVRVENLEELLSAVPAE